MNRVFPKNVLLALCLGMAAPALAETKPKTEPTPRPSKSADTSAAAPAKAKSMPMYARVDSIDLANHTFTMKRKKDGAEIKHVLPAAAEVRQGDGSAKFSEIKVGDWVSGSRIKKSEMEYEIVKITKFGPRETKADKKE